MPGLNGRWESARTLNELCAESERERERERERECVCVRERERFSAFYTHRDTDSRQKESERERERARERESERARAQEKFSAFYTHTDKPSMDGLERTSTCPRRCKTHASASCSSVSPTPPPTPAPVRAVGFCGVLSVLFRSPMPECVVWGLVWVVV